jgi:hypothetical protein
MSRHVTSRHVTSRHVTTGVTQYFWSRQTLIILHSKLYRLPFEISRSLKTFKTSTNQYLVSNEYFYMVNPCCDVTKTTVNEIKNISKMADISLLQVKISKNKARYEESNNYFMGSVFGWPDPNTWECCSTFGKRKNTLACGSNIFTLSKSLATSLVHGSRNPARKTFGIPLVRHLG